MKNIVLLLLASILFSSNVIAQTSSNNLKVALFSCECWINIQEGKQKICDEFRALIDNSLDSLQYIHSYQFISDTNKLADKSNLVYIKAIATKANDSARYYFDVEFIDAYDLNVIVSFKKSPVSKKNEIDGSLKYSVANSISLLMQVYFIPFNQDATINTREISAKATKFIFDKSIDSKKKVRKVATLLSNLVDNSFRQQQNFKTFQYATLQGEDLINPDKHTVFISSELLEEKDKYYFSIRVKGTDVILEYPDGKPIKLQFELDKQRIDNKDFTEFMYEISASISSLIILNK